VSDSLGRLMVVPPVKQALRGARWRSSGGSTETAAWWWRQKKGRRRGHRPGTEPFQDSTKRKIWVLKQVFKNLKVPMV